MSDNTSLSHELIQVGYVDVQARGEPIILVKQINGFLGRLGTAWIMLTHKQVALVPDEISLHLSDGWTPPPEDVYIEAIVEEESIVSCITAIEGETPDLYFGQAARNITYPMGVETINDGDYPGVDEERSIW